MSSPSSPDDQGQEQLDLDKVRDASPYDYLDVAMLAVDSAMSRIEDMTKLGDVPSVETMLRVASANAMCGILSALASLEKMAREDMEK